jgi:hypothetical protein
MREVIYTEEDYVREEFYDKFRCKQGACAHCCCEGWNITVSMKEYFRLVGLRCGKKLRSELDVAFHPVEDEADEERYAFIAPDFFGSCPMRRSDGLCRLQTECGENVLPAVCRTYPRSIRNDLGEAALSNSCEGVVETLFGIGAPMKFVGEIRERGDIPYYGDLRNKTEEILQNEKVPFVSRTEYVGELLTAVRDSRGKGLAAIDGFVPSEQKYCADGAERIRGIIGLVKWIGDSSAGENELCSKILGVLEADKNDNETSAKIFETRKKEFYNRFPDAEKYLEQIFVNHIFYEKFPFVSKNTDFEGEYRALCAAYSYIMAVFVCGTDTADKISLAAAAADAFRFIAHSDFDRAASELLPLFGFRNADALENFIGA